jgi:hypothetical protein
MVFARGHDRFTRKTAVGARTMPYESDGREIFVIAGTAVYKALLDRCATIYVIVVQQDY